MYNYTLAQLKKFMEDRTPLILDRPRNPKNFSVGWIGIIDHINEYPNEGQLVKNITLIDNNPTLWMKFSNGSAGCVQPDEVRPARLRPGVVFQIKSTFIHTTSKRYCADDNEAAIRSDKPNGTRTRKGRK